MVNQTEEAAQATKFSALNCIDLSNPDVNQSVNLLKQVGFSIYKKREEEEEELGYTVTELA